MRLVGNSATGQAAYGGALYGDFGDTEGSAHIGSIDHFNTAPFTFTGCDSIVITGNYVKSSWKRKEEDRDQDPGEFANGGAIFVSGSVTSAAHPFEEIYMEGLYANPEPDYENRTGSYVHAPFPVTLLEFTNNKSVYICDNYVNEAGTVWLNAIATDGAGVMFKMYKGQTVECYDGLTIDGGLYINGDIYSKGEDKDFTGVITFNGSNTEERLKAVAGGASYTAEEIRRSRSARAEGIYIYNGTVNLIKYRLEALVSMGIAEPDIHLGYHFISSPAALVKMQNSVIWTRAQIGNTYSDDPNIVKSGHYGIVQLNHASYTGHNDVYANILVASESEWEFNVSKSNKNTAVLSVHFADTSVSTPAYRRNQQLYFLNQTFVINALDSLTAGTAYKLMDFNLYDIDEDGDTYQLVTYGSENLKVTGEVECEVTEGKGSGEVYYVINEKDGIWTLYYEPKAEEDIPVIEEEEEGERILTWTTKGERIWANGKGGGAQSEDGAWLTEPTWSAAKVKDLNFRHGDKVIFAAADTVTISGEVKPNTITVAPGGGSVIFTGKGSVTANSVNLNSGTLVLDAMKMSVATSLNSKEGTTLSMKSGSLNMLKGSNASLQSLKVYGVNTASSESGSISAESITFSVSEQNSEDALLDVKGLLKAKNFTIEVDKDLKRGLYMLMVFDNWDNTDASFSGSAQSTQIGEKGKDDIYVENNTLWFDYSAVDPDARDTPATLTWTTKGERIWAVGTGSGRVWDKEKEEWNQVMDPTWEAPVEDLNFYDGDSVVFNKADDVTVSGDVAPKKVTVKNSSGTVRFTGSGSIVGKTGLVKSGNGVLEIEIANSYTGTTNLNGGTTIVRNAKAFGGSNVVFTKGSLNLGGNAVGNQLEIAAASETFAVLKLENFKSEEDPWAISEEEAQPEEEEAQPAPAVKSAIVLNGASKYAGNLVLSSGRVRGENIRLSKTATLYAGAIENNLSGSGKVVKKGNGTVELSGVIKHTGGTEVQGGTLILESATLTGAVSVGEGAWLTAFNSKVNKLSDTDKEKLSAEEIETLVAGRVLTVGKKGTLTVSKSEVHGKLVFDEESTVVADLFTLEAYDSMELHGGSVTANIELAGGTLETIAPEPEETTAEQSAELAPEEAEVEPQKIDGHLALSGGTLKLADTLVVSGNLHSTAETLVTFDLEKLVEKKELVLLSAGSTADLKEEHLVLSEMEDVRHSVGMTAKEVSVKLESETLTWVPGSTNVWAVRAKGGAWALAGDKDNCFYNLDNVVFEDAGEVRIEGEVRPGSVTVQGKGNTLYTGTGSIIGAGKMVKTGSGVLEIATDNAKYSGEIAVNGGTLAVGHKNALGSGAVSVHNAALVNKDGHELANAITVSGNSTLQDAQGGAATLSFTEGAKVDGSYTLGMNNVLTLGEGSASFTGNFIFAGGTIKLGSEECVFDLSEGKSGFSPIRAVVSGAAIDLSDWESIVYGQAYKLITFDTEKVQAEDFAIIGKEGRYTLDVHDSTLWITFKRPQADPAIAAALGRNQRAAYMALSKVAEKDNAAGALAETAETVLAAETAPEAAALLERLSGEELATTMTSQIEGNLAHLRRLRSNMGSGQMLTPGSRNAMYLVGYDDLSRVRGDASGQGIHRSEWGGMLGYEYACSRSALVGAALTSGWARVSPSGAQRYHEDSRRVDAYAEFNLGGGWQSITGVGVGLHSFDMRRSLPEGNCSSAKGVDGWSLNFSEELSYTQNLSEKSCLQGYLAVESSVNHIDSFTESGAGALSLGGAARNAWATDVTLGARYLQSFDTAAGKGMLSLQAGLVASVGDTASNLELHFTGAPDVVYSVTSANRNRWGYNLGASVSVPLSKSTSVTAGVNAVLRGDSKEAGANIGLRTSF